ncbi:MFS transporter [Streptosporangium algeriense]|uniref:MFS transporter n=1 Tax=Streptosporangium algeriense TaxID=1682748 RepID=A0ABW3DJP3_9ACTN
MTQEETQSTSSLLRGNRRFQQFWIAETLVAYGSQITFVVLPLVAVLILNATPMQLGLLTALERASFPILGLLAGAWLDRMNLRATLALTDLARAVLVLIVPVAYWTGWLSFPLLLVISLLLGLMYVLFEIAYISVIPHLVDSIDDLPKANASLQASSATAGILGPGAAGMLLAVLSAPVVLLFTTASFLVSTFLLLVGVQRDAEAEDRKRSRDPILASIRIGWHRVWRNRTLRGIAQMAGIHLFCYAAFQTLIILYLVNVLDLGGFYAALFFGAMGAGFLLGSIICGRLNRALGIGRAMLLGTIGADLAAIAITVVPQPTVFRGPLVVALAVLMGIGWQVCTLNSVSLRQALTPLSLQARVNSVIRVISWSAAPLGGLVGGFAAGQWGVRTTLMLTAIAMLGAVIPILMSPLVSISVLPRQPELAE